MRLVRYGSIRAANLRRTGTARNTFSDRGSRVQLRWRRKLLGLCSIFQLRLA
jgi:hypothetical protein